MPSTKNVDALAQIKEDLADVQAVWVVAAFLIPQVHFVAGALPVLFPNVVIFFLQSRGKLVPNDEKPAAGEAGKTIPEEDEPEDHPGPFEV